ncbi:MAG TPA: winged helix-turn-helix domain-containing protein [Solirubrobacterales bacterium]|nr:winged helix-turn-helix domain-containing protein [Solirubrobacterales bacterium]
MVVARAVGRHRGKRKPKGIEQAVQYAISHPIRVEILILLNQGSYTAGEVAELTEIPLSNVSNHIKRMLDDGSIEVAKIEERRGTNLYWYRAVVIPYYSKKEAEALTQTERQHIAGAIVTSGTAEVIAALLKGNLADPRTILSWDWYQVDKKGRADLEAENARHLERVREIECESTNRVAKTKEATISILISLSAFVRARKAPRPRSRSCERRLGMN